MHKLKQEGLVSIEAVYPHGCIVVNIGGVKREIAKCELHPLIHTSLNYTLALNVVSIKKRSHGLRKWYLITEHFDLMAV
jgi:hypothetical protein